MIILIIMDINLHKQYQKVQEKHWWFKVRDKVLLDIISRYINVGDAVLDFGCNYGHSVRLLKNNGYKSMGVDISEEAITYGKSLNISDIYLTSNKKFVKNSFDAVVATDVLEHIEDDKMAFDYIWSLVKSGGLVVITVPAFMFLWGVQDEVSHHFRRYRMHGLESLLGSVGDFELVKKSYFNTFLFLPIAFVRLVSRLFNVRSRNSDLSINNQFLNKLFFAIFNLERKILKYANFPIGTSALLVLRKR